MCALGGHLCFLFQAEDCIRVSHESLDFRRVLFRSLALAQVPAEVQALQPQTLLNCVIRLGAICRPDPVVWLKRNAVKSLPSDLLVSVVTNGTAMLRNRSEEHTSELPTLMRTSYPVFCLKKQTYTATPHTNYEPRKK